jgi:hypothetical protein
MARSEGLAEARREELQLLCQAPGAVGAGGRMSLRDGLEALFSSSSRR